MILRTIFENEISMTESIQLATVSSLVLIIGLALIGFAIKKLIHLMMG